MLAFDDALASVWLVVGPLLRRYGLRAVTYAIPGRVADAPSVRPTVDEGEVDAVAADSAENPFATWPELRALSSTGVIDVQSHTWSHSMMFCDDRPLGVFEPGGESSILNRPRLNVGDPPRFLTSSQLGWPLFARRSRMSDARRYLPDEAACAKTAEQVSSEGGAAFFARPDWRDRLASTLEAVGGRWETDEERERALEHELVAARDALEHRLGCPVRHVCLPWGVAGELSRTAMRRIGIETAFANRLSGSFAVRAGDDRFALKRLPNRHIFTLPGRGRRLIFQRA
jgi:hypothetical protein